MIADFYNTFDESSNKGSDIPQEVLDVLSEELPSSFRYYQNEKGKYMVGPKPEHISDNMVLKVDIDKEFIDEYLKDIPKNKWPEYLYCMQLRVPVKNLKIGDKEKQIPIEKTLGNPLNDSVKVTKSYMYPEPFPPAKELKFETEEGDTIVINIARKPHANLKEALFTNTNLPAIQMQFIIADNLVDSKVKYTVTPTKADTVSEALAAIHLFNGLYNGTIKIDGRRIGASVIEKSEKDFEQLKNATNLWETAKKLEEKLKVSFVPSADFPMEDVEFFAQLETCILNNKSIVWSHPFDHFHMNSIDVSEGKFEDFFGKEGVACEFLEGPIHATLLGAEFELYSYTKMSNMVITNIVWDNDEKKSGEVYIADPIGDKWKLYRKYITKEQIDTLK